MRQFDLLEPCGESEMHRDDFGLANGCPQPGPQELCNQRYKAVAGGHIAARHEGQVLSSRQKSNDSLARDVRYSLSRLRVEVVEKRHSHKKGREIGIEMIQDFLREVVVHVARRAVQ